MDGVVTEAIAADQLVYEIVDGNDQLASALKRKVKKQFKKASVVKRIEQNQTGVIVTYTNGDGDQTITADGSFGRPDDSMALTMTNVDLAGIDTLLLRPPQFTGRLDAAGTLTGTREVPGLKGDFRVTGGGFRKFQYESFAGNVDYVARGLTVDVRLQQNPTQWIAAKGYWGMAPASRVDLAIDSSPIELGIVQGFVPELTDVRGCSKHMST